MSASPEAYNQALAAVDGPMNKALASYKYNGQAQMTWELIVKALSPFPLLMWEQKAHPTNVGAHFSTDTIVKNQSANAETTANNDIFTIMQKNARGMTTDDDIFVLEK